MSVEPKNVSSSFAEQLSSFDDKLHATASNAEMLAGIRQGIDRLLKTSGNSEAEIREVLQEQYDAGALRKETFQLVKSMLDRYATENMPTNPGPDDPLPIVRSASISASATLPVPIMPKTAPANAKPPVAVPSKTVIDNTVPPIGGPPKTAPADIVPPIGGPPKTVPVNKAPPVPAPPKTAPVNKTPPVPAPPKTAPVNKVPPVPAPPKTAPAVVPTQALVPVMPIGKAVQNDGDFGATAIIANEFSPQNPSESQVQVGSLLRDRFLLQEKIAGGSMGVVYKAMDRRLAETGSNDHWVAIKVLSPKLAGNVEALRALQQEAAKGRCLVHPNIVQFVDLDRDDKVYFLIMEWLEGRTLAEILDSKDASIINQDAALRITRQIGAALDYAHSRGIVHADIKPGNVMILPNGDAKLFDFGIARVRQQHVDTQFDPGVLGAMTPAYSSMQVLTGEEPVASDDVFSLSCLLYRLLAGYRVFGPRNAAEASEEGMKPQRLNGLNDSQWGSLKKGLSYSRVARFSSVREFIDALEKDNTEPFIVEDEPARVVEVIERPAGGKWVGVFLLLAGLAAIAAAYQFGYLDALIGRSAFPDAVATTAPRTIENNSSTIVIPDETLPAELLEMIESDAESVSGRNAVGAGSGPDVETPDAVSEPNSEVTSALLEPLSEETSSAVEAEPEAASTAIQTGPEAVSAIIPVGSEATAERDEPQLAEAEAAVPEAVVEQITAIENALASTDPLSRDFATLPPPTEVIPFSPRGGNVKPVNVTIREGGPAFIIDFVRGSGLSEPLTLRLEEVGFSGDRSPWEAGEYVLSNSGMIHFPAGQSRGRITLTLASDALREPDQQSTLRLRDTGLAESELAVVNVTIEDDDQRSFEARLPRNTISFAMNNISVSEADSAVQMDLVRFNPDGSSVDVQFRVNDISAHDGQDYFGPGAHLISFGPGQRSARLLIPLVQDAEIEGDESFIVELVTNANGGAAGVDQRVRVTIRDDDSQIF
jgi:serine/threonine protein kinase